MAATRMIPSDVDGGDQLARAVQATTASGTIPSDVDPKLMNGDDPIRRWME